MRLSNPTDFFLRIQEQQKDIPSDKRVNLENELCTWFKYTPPVWDKKRSGVYIPLLVVYFVQSGDQLPNLSHLTT